jgi:hypothetical protein
MGDMLLLGFFFLLRPGEYAWTDNDNTAPFCLANVHLILNNICLDPLSCPEQQLLAITFVALEFTNQKNVRGELVGLGRSRHNVLYPVLVLLNRVKHLRLHQAPLHKDGARWQCIDTTTLTLCLRHTIQSLPASNGISAEDISIHSLCSSGAMALLCVEVDPDKIRLFGRWRSDKMLHYLHIQAYPLVSPLAPLMVHHGQFTLIPNQRLG